MHYSFGPLGGLMRRICLAVGLLALLPGCGGGRLSVTDLAGDDVVSIEVTFGNLPDHSPDVEWFQAVPEDFDHLLGLLRDGTPDPHPLPWQGLGNLTIRTRAGGEVRAALYQTYGQVGAYSVGRAYYLGGSDDEFIRVLRECHEHAQAKADAGGKH
jgi:hypothetical protein